jgi:uncharacterized protein YggT (Ycf19 family)
LTYQITRSLIEGVILFLNIYSWIIVINSLLSFILDPRHRVRMFLKRITDPILAPFRMLAQRMGAFQLPIDFTPMLALICIWLLISLLNRLSFYLYRIIYFS